MKYLAHKLCFLIAHVSDLSRWKTAHQCCKGRCKLQAHIKGVNFGAKLTHLVGFWLDIIIFLIREKKKEKCENHHSLLWFGRIGLCMKIYDIAFWWVYVFLSMYTMYIINNMLFTGWEVRIGRNCARGLEYWVLRPRAQFLLIQTDLGRWITFLFFSDWDLKVSGKFYFKLQPMCVEEGRVCIDVMHTIDCKPKQNITTWFLTCNLYYHN